MLTGNSKTSGVSPRVGGAPPLEDSRDPLASMLYYSEGGMMRLEALIELEFIDSSFASLLSYWK